MIHVNIKLQVNQGRDLSEVGDGTIEERFRTFPLPKEFELPGGFRARLEQQSQPPPALPCAPAVAYPLLIGALAGWVVFGWRFNQAHFPVSLGPLCVFFGVFLVLFVLLMFYGSLQRRARSYPVFQRLAAAHPGAFLVVEGGVPALYYARSKWIGRLDFDEGGRSEEPVTRLVARFPEARKWLEIRKRGVLGRFLGGSEAPVVTLPEGEFSRRFVVLADDPAAARGFLDERVMNAVQSFGTFKDPVLTVQGNLVLVQVKGDFSAPRKEGTLAQFLAAAEVFVGAAAGEERRAFAGAARRSGAAAELFGTEGAPSGGRRWLRVCGLVLLAVIVALGAAERSFHRQFVARAEELRRLSGAPGPAPVSAAELERLPEPVRNYLRFAGVVGKRRIGAVHLRGEGAVLGGRAKSWRPFQSEVCFTVAKPTLCGYLRARYLGVFHVAFLDTFAEGRGRKIARLQSVFPRVDTENDELTLGLFLRFLTEMPVYPTVFLDETRVKWGTSDATSAEMVWKDGTLEWPAKFTFAADGSVATVEMKRPLRRGGKVEQQKWTGRYGAYREFDGYRLPTRFEATWNFPAGDVTFARFTAEAIEVDR